MLSAWRDPVLSLRVRLQRKAGLVEQGAGSAVSLCKCYIHKARCAATWDRVFHRRYLYVATQVHKAYGSPLSQGYVLMLDFYMTAAHLVQSIGDCVHK